MDTASTKEDMGSTKSSAKKTKMSTDSKMAIAEAVLVSAMPDNNINDWLTIFKIFILIGATIFTIGQFSGISDTDLAAYIWFAIGVSISWILSMRAISVNEKDEQSDWFSAMNNAALMLPTLGTLMPLGILIFILIKVRPILQNNINNLPTQFFWFNKLTFFLVVMQMFILSQFYENVLSPSENNSRGLWIALMILLSVLTSAAAVELYVIITAFITDG